MTPDDLARLHANAMTSTTPWTAKAFKQLLADAGTFVITPSDLEHHLKRAQQNQLQGMPTPTAQSFSAFAIGRVVLDEAELLTLAVDPKCQRQGYGRACLSAFEREAAKLGARTVHLEVAESNVPARALYDAAEWRQVGRRKAYYVDGPDRIDAILMSKRLAAG